MSDIGRSVSEVAKSDLDLVRAALADEYELLGEIGRGGMAIVFRARDRALDRDVAIKMLPVSMSYDADFVERFQREARMSAQLEHPNIVPIYRVGRSDQVIYFVMKYLRGASLGSVLAQRQTLTPEEVRSVLRDTAHALAYAARRGVVHRDIKPDNILYDEDRWVLADFGIAKTATAPSLTQSGAAVGTPHYMSPEQARARPIDGRADIYSLGIVAYQCLTGRLPFDADDGFAIMYDHVSTPLPAPDPPLEGDDARTLYSIIERMTEKDPANRIADGDTLLTVLDGVRRPTPLFGSQAIQPATRPISGLVTLDSQTSIPTIIVTAATGLPAVSGPLLPLPPRPEAEPARIARRRWPWAAAAAVLVAAALGAYLTHHYGVSPAAHAPPAPAAATVAPPLPAPPTPQPSPATLAADAKCGTNAAAFKVILDPIADQQRDTPLEVTYDVCGLASGALIYGQIVIRHRSTSALGKLLGNNGPFAFQVDDHASGRLTRVRHKLTVPHLKPGDYSLYVGITDRRGRRREQIESFQVAERP